MGEAAYFKRLLDPDTYPEKTLRVEVRETHISRVYLTDTHAYKFKKPLDLGFLNFVTLDSRKHYCHEEVRLNQRFCPQIYLGVVTLNRRGDRFSINGPGEVIDYAVQMRRMPEALMLDQLLEQPDASLSTDMERLASTLKSLYPKLPVCKRNKPNRYLDLMSENWNENFSQTHPFIGHTLPKELFHVAKQYVAGFFAEHASALLRREDNGFVRDCHGDLHSKNICMMDPICVYDCIEFNERFRIADILSDIAFLLMDLEFRGHRPLAKQLKEELQPILGNTPDIDSLLPFYKLYRAWVRGKVQSMLFSETDVEEALRLKAGQNAARYFNLALGNVCPPGLVLTCGLMGTGKTTVAQSLTESTGANLLRSDVIRKELMGSQGDKSHDAPFNGGIYAPDRTRKTYEALFERTEEALEAGTMVIVDASFSQTTERNRFTDLAKRKGRPCLLLQITCRRSLAFQRLDRRRQKGDDASDGRRDLYDLQAARFEFPGREESKMTVDTSKNVDYNVSLILSQYLGKAGMAP